MTVHLSDALQGGFFGTSGGKGARTDVFKVTSIELFLQTTRRCEDRCFFPVSNRLSTLFSCNA